MLLIQTAVIYVASINIFYQKYLHYKFEITCIHPYSIDKITLLWVILHVLYIFLGGGEQIILCCVICFQKRLGLSEIPKMYLTNVVFRVSATKQSCLRFHVSISESVSRLLLLLTEEAKVLPNTGEDRSCEQQ